jgi:hypothetical protein
MMSLEQPGLVFLNQTQLWETVNKRDCFPIKGSNLVNSPGLGVC